MSPTRFEISFDLSQYGLALYQRKEKEIKSYLSQTRKMTRVNPDIGEILFRFTNMNSKTARISAAGQRGHAILDDMFKTLERMDQRYPRSLTQIEGCRMCLGSLSWHFFGEAIYAEMPLILKRLKVTELSRWYFAEMPRREGKTMLMCILTACTMYIVDDESFLVYSNGGRASNSYHNQVFEMLLFLCGDDHTRFQEYNAETIRFTGLHKGQKASMLKCFPSSPDVRMIT